ncbi:hypothetical protein [Streptomyces sp. NPDC007905]|uniref:hypothetical protein n=1 Tax=Streptomyces sp. NPDC007905 TaxID=3364788 RepID=UPI0036E127C1
MLWRSRRTRGTDKAQPPHESSPTRLRADDDPPVGGLAEVRIIAANPDSAHRVAQLLRENFRSDEPRSYPAGSDGRSTLLHLTVDTGNTPRIPRPEPPWLVSSRSQAQRAHVDEPG